MGTLPPEITLAMDGQIYNYLVYIGLECDRSDIFTH